MTQSLQKLNKPESKASILSRLRRLVRPKRESVTVAEMLEFRREAYGLTAAEFSWILGMSPTHYSEFVHGRRSLPIKATRRAFAVGVPAHILLQIPKEDATA